MKREQRDDLLEMVIEAHATFPRTAVGRTPERVAFDALFGAVEALLHEVRCEDEVDESDLDAAEYERQEAEQERIGAAIARAEKAETCARDVLDSVAELARLRSAITNDTPETIEAAAKAYKQATLTCDDTSCEAKGAGQPGCLAGIRAARKVLPLPRTSAPAPVEVVEWCVAALRFEHNAAMSENIGETIPLTAAQEAAMVRAVLTAANYPWSGKHALGKAIAERDAALVEVARLNSILSADLVPEWSALSVSMAIARGQGAEKENVELRAEVERLTNASKTSNGCDLLGPVTEEEHAWGERACYMHSFSPRERTYANAVLASRRALAGEPTVSEAEEKAASAYAAEGGKSIRGILLAAAKVRAGGAA